MNSRRIVITRSDMSRLTQETLTIIGASIALAALILTSSASVRGEVQAVRDEIRDVRAEARADRETFERHIDALRAEARADRETFERHIDVLRAEARADRETFQRHITRLTEQQDILSGHVESVRNQLATAR